MSTGKLNIDGTKKKPLAGGPEKNKLPDDSWENLRNRVGVKVKETVRISS